ncbi:hypothetical protein ACRE_031530 [Hapsidospora chrysogenum ATCC 11550]|uniref:Uncharacterized protein n=1 Tax=Hapsidospora chrysogenum (strain ATCC 11550 / CBS 779.69 / DSM 880 / IAM 14645 / JCM 23072 / IMI 49137) TaxID=857340 RepID=A0A086T9E2_HAPC1|nr:hypothetical protein ACRE_031530 [Hapsidospora chrysogenum ATCC 11550]
MGDAQQANNPTLTLEIASKIKDWHELIQELQDELKNLSRRRSRNTLRPSAQARCKSWTRMWTTSSPFCSKPLGLMQQRGTGEVRDGIGEVQDGIEDMRVLLRQLSAHRITQNLRKWLKAPDATTNRGFKERAQGYWILASVKHCLQVMAR